MPDTVDVDDDLPLKAQVIRLRHEVQELAGALEKLNEVLEPEEVRRIIDRVLRLLDGEPASGAVGLRKRVDDLETCVKDINQERATTKALLRGIFVGLALTGATSAGTLVTLLSQVIK